MKVQIDVSSEIWKQSKANAALKGVTMIEYVERALRRFDKDFALGSWSEDVTAKKIEDPKVPREVPPSVSAGVGSGSTTMSSIAKSGAYS